VISPLSETECYFYRAILTRHRDRQETLRVPFFLDGGAGKVMIDPRGAETDLQPSFSEDVEWDSAPDYIRHFLSRHGVTPGQVEEYLYPCKRPFVRDRHAPRQSGHRSEE